MSSGHLSLLAMCACACSEHVFAVHAYVKEKACAWVCVRVCECTQFTWPSLNLFALHLWKSARSYSIVEYEYKYTAVLLNMYTLHCSAIQCVCIRSLNRSTCTLKEEKSTRDWEKASQVNECLFNAYIYIVWLPFPVRALCFHSCEL